MTDLFPFSRADKLAALRREIEMRKAVYGRRVTDNKMSREKADREIAVMEAIAEDYEKESGE